MSIMGNFKKRNERLFQWIKIPLFFLQTLMLFQVWHQEVAYKVYDFWGVTMRLRIRHLLLIVFVLYVIGLVLAWLEEKKGVYRAEWLARHKVERDPILYEIRDLLKDD